MDTSHVFFTHWWLFFASYCGQYIVIAGDEDVVTSSSAHS